MNRNKLSNTFSTSGFLQLAEHIGQSAIGLLARRELIFPAILLILVFVLSIFHIHGSSVSVYHTIFTGELVSDPNLLLNGPRGIRSDEWLVATPLAVSQSHNDFEHFNEFIGVGQDLSLLYDAPTNHWSGLFRPYNWSFFLFSDFEQAFAFKWWFRGAFLMTAAYALLMMVTKKNYWLSIGGALLLFFSPFIQWWYSVMVLESITYMFWCLFFALKIFHFKQKKQLIPYSIGLAYFILCSIFIVYPPFLISLALGGAAFLTGYVLNHRKSLTKTRFKSMLVSVLTSLGLTGIIGFFYYLDFKDIIGLIGNTAYPGRRIISGGGYSISQVFDGFYNFLLKDDTKILPKALNNQSEAASFFMLSLFAIPFALLNNLLSRVRKVDFVSLAMAIYLGGTLLWLVVGLPEIVGKVTFLYLVPHNRMMIGIFAFAFLYLFYFLSQKADSSRKTLGLIGVFTILILIVHVWLGHHFMTNYPEFVDGQRVIVIASGAATISGLLLLWRKTRLFLGFIILFAIYSTWRVNPIYVGLSPITDSPLTAEISAIEQTNTAKSRWAVYGTNVLGSFLAANGVRTLNGVHMYPQFELWSSLDPDGEYDAQYNRYAHVIFRPGSAENVAFDAPQGDVLNVTISPCHTFFEEFDVKFFASVVPLNYSCLQPIKDVEYATTHVFFYKTTN